MAVTAKVDSRDTELHHLATQSAHYQSSTNLKVDTETIQDLQAGYCNRKSSNSCHGTTNSTVCGVACCRPAVIQPCARMECFTAVHSLAALLMMSMSTYISSQITTLERQFGFSSTISGLLMSCSDLGCLLTTLPFSHLARRVHIPRALAECAMVYGLSGLLCTVPFFAARSSLLVSSRSMVELNASRNDDNITFGFSAPLCLDDSLKNPAEDGYSVANNTPLYYGIIVSVSFFGPVLAFLLGGVFTSIYITLEDTTMSPGHPRWIGAWWLGFLVFGIANIIVAVPLMFFPRRLGPQPRAVAIKEEQVRAFAQGKQFKHDVKEFFRSVKRVALTPVCMLVVLGNCCLVMGGAGLASFLPKYMEAQFFVPPWQASLFMCFAISLPILLGVLTGGFVTTRFQFPPMKCVKFIMILMLVCSSLSVATLLLGCDQPKIDMGMTSPSMSVTNTSQRCQSRCQCDDSRYFPTCGADNVTYFSPCHAGCSENRGQSYRHCSCIAMPSNTSDPGLEARPGLCGQNCNMLYPYIIMTFFSELLVAMTVMPLFMPIARSVTETDKGLAIGVNIFSCTLLGMFPSPLVFGRIVDSTCLLWSFGCAGDGSCSLYDVRDFRVRFNAMLLSTRVLALLFYAIAFVVASRQRRPFFSHCDADTEVDYDEQILTESMNIETNLE